MTRRRAQEAKRTLEKKKECVNSNTWGSIVPVASSTASEWKKTLEKECDEIC